MKTNPKPSLFHEVSIEFHSPDLHGRMVREGDKWKMETMATNDGTVSDTLELSDEQAGAVILLFTTGEGGIQDPYGVIGDALDGMEPKHRPIP